MFAFKFDWQPNYETGVEAVDTQHKQLMRIGREIEQLIQTKAVGVSPKQLIDIVCELRDYTGYHFYMEEQLMEECGYEDIAQHKKHHQELLKMVMNFDVTRLADDPVGTLEKGRALLQEQIFQHIMKDDMELAKVYKHYEKIYKRTADAKKKNRSDNENKFGFEVYEFNMTIAYLLRDQTYYGHVVIVNKEKKANLLKLSRLEKDTFVTDVFRLAEAVNKAFEPDSLDYAYYTAADDQLLVHIVPRYKNDEHFNEPFCYKPETPVELSQEEYNRMVERIKKEIV